MELLPKELEEEVVEEIVGTDEVKDLVVFNDDYNTFDHVIDTLVKVCNHGHEQAEQCTWIIHYKGKCTVRKGQYYTLLPMRQGICDAGISAEIM